MKVILVVLGGYIRSQLTESRVDFFVPGSQLFAASFLMSLRERDSSGIELFAPRENSKANGVPSNDQVSSDERWLATLLD
ncbi:hypothetical protein [Stenotrophomonas sp. S39]|uniref:hypothetical protein n=1 Tax=Stenotrophomonas sp. S39 TaxID=2767451 RepID=UPI00190DAAFE|nr:hypothetical protein [Stenotrophomonas sp. S39]MBK0052713.1 hypothetical protein [Stenotrophomonas sp. S39]